MVRKFLLILVAALVVFASAQTLQAALTAVGPIDPGNGFPVYYTDPAALSLVPCLTENPAAPTLNPFCVLLADPFFDAVNPVIFTSNFPIEFFYWIADASGLGPNVKVARFALEGTFTNLPTQPVDGLQTVFQRIRFVFTAPVAGGTYTITHPFAAAPLSFTAATAGQLIKYTLDVPLGLPLNFTTALTGQIGPFLRCAAGGPFIDPAGNTYIGNPTIGCPVSGGPFGNSVTVAGPDIGGAGVNSVTTSTFLVAGKIWNGLLPSGLSVKRATYSRTPANAVEVDVFATGDLGATVTFTDGTTPTVTMVKDGIDALSARFFGKSNPLAPPALVTVTATLPPATPTVLTKTVTDLVTMSRAQYSTSSRVLVIEAASSDQLAPIPTLTATGFGPLSQVGPALVPPEQRLIVPNIEPPAQVTVTSPKGGSATKLVQVLQSIPPIAVNDTASTDNVHPVVIPVLANDVDLDGNLPLTVPAATLTQPLVTAGSVVINPDQTLTFAPVAGFVGTATFTYQAADSFNVLSNIATVTVTVTAPVTPVAVNDTALTTVNTAVTINVLANDTGAVLTVASVTQPPVTAGTVVNNGTSVTFTPALNFAGVTTFTYVATNGTLLSNTATVTVTVNDIPRAVNDTASTNQGVPVVINVVGNDVDLVGGIVPSTIALVTGSGPASGSVTFNTPSAGQVTYTPNVAGTFTFTYTVKDALGATSNQATVTVTVNAAPVANNDSATTTITTAVTINVLANDSGGIAPLLVTNLTQPVILGTPTPSGTVANNGTSVTFTPATNFTGQVTFTYRAQDAAGSLSNIATVTVTVTAAVAPVAVNDSYTTTVNTPIPTMTVLANDTNAATIASFTQPAAGTGTVTRNTTNPNVLTYTPPANFTGGTSFTYVAADTAGVLSNTATVTVTVNPVAGATITIKSSQWDTRKFVWNLGGNVTPKALASTVTLELWNSSLTIRKGIIATVSVPANRGSWSFLAAGGAGAPVAGDIVKAISSFGVTGQAAVVLK